MQRFFVLFTAVLLASEGNGKPLKAEQLFYEDALGSTEASSEPNQDTNVTSVLRNKRDVSLSKEYLKNYCRRKTRSLPAASNSNLCEEGSYLCLGYKEIVCKTTSFACLSSVPRVGSPDCIPKFGWVNITLGSRGLRQVRRTIECKCA